MAIFQSVGMVALLNNISSILARQGIIASPSNFRISPGIPTGTTDLFLSIFAILFLITVVLIPKVSPELANFISRMSPSQQRTDA